jgi:hypothetical protein
MLQLDRRPLTIDCGLLSRRVIGEFAAVIGRLSAVKFIEGPSG